MKTFFTKLKKWFVSIKPSKRRIVQLYASLLYNANIKGFITGRIYKGVTKNICVPGFNCYSCPGAVGACPLGSLQNALLASSTRLPAYIFGIIILFGLLLGRTICGWLCPVGLIQELTYKIKSPKLKKNKVTHALSYLKYVILLLTIAFAFVIPNVPFFCKYFCPAGTLEGGIIILSNPNNNLFFNSLNYIFSWKFLILVAILVSSVFIYRVFCRFFCPLGAIYGFFCRLAMLGVKIDKDKCTDCGLCIDVCKMDISRVGDHECIHCGDCIDICPTKAISWKGSQFFLHENQIDDCGEVEEKPIDFTSGINTVATSENLTANEVVIEQKVEQINEETVAEKIENSKNTTKEKKKKGKKFWIECIAWILASLVLVFALVYYNFLTPSDNTAVYGVGDMMPNLTITKINSDEETEITSANLIGKVTVLNYWYIDCGPCVAELPNFEEVQDRYGDKVNIIAVHQGNYAQNKKINEMIENSGWKEWDITFAVDPVSEKDQSYLMFGGTGGWPYTVIINPEGKITYVHVNELEKDILIKEVENALAK